MCVYVCMTGKKITKKEERKKIENNEKIKK